MKLPPRFKLAAFSFDFGFSISAAKLFRLFLLFLCQGEALGFFATCRAFPNIVSSVTVSHEVLTLNYAQALPKLFGSISSRPGYAAFFVFLPAMTPGNGHNLRWRISVLANVDSNANLPLRDFSQCISA